MRAVGNIVGARRIAALLYASGQSLNTSTGVITGIYCATGNLLVDTGSAAKPAIVQINDPNGRFGRAQSPDARLSVDDANATVHAGTGYPMCVPRTDPATADDAACPQANRPKPSATGQCRNFSVSGIAPPVSGELTASVGLPYCSEFVMNTVAARAATDPDPRQQAPFEVGDAVTFSGTLIPATATAPAYTSAHTVEANLGIYTMPSTQPSYLAIGQFGVGTADPSAISINGFAVETQDRIFLETETTDVKTPVEPSSSSSPRTSSPVTCSSPSTSGTCRSCATAKARRPSRPSGQLWDHWSRPRGAGRLRPSQVPRQLGQLRLAMRQRL